MGFISLQDVYFSLQSKKKKFFFRQVTVSRGTRHHYPLKQSKMTNCLMKAVISNLKLSSFQNQSGI